MKTHSLTVVNSLVTRYSLQKWPAAYCRIHSLLVESLLATRYSLMKLLLATNRSSIVAKNYSLVVEKIACCKKLLVLVAEIAGCLLQKLLVTCCRNCSLQKNHAPLVMRIPCNIVCSKAKKLGKTLSLFNISCFLKPKNWFLFQVNKVRLNQFLSEHCLTR